MVRALSFLYLLLLRFGHVTLDVEARHFRFAVGTYGNGLLEVTGELSGAVVRNLDLTALARLNRVFRVFGNRAATAGNGLVDNQRLVTGIRESEYAR